MSDKTFYPQSTLWPNGKTLSVGKLVEILKLLDQSLPVIIQSPPRNACYGAGVCYTVDKVEHLDLPHEEVIIPAYYYICEETGKRRRSPRDVHVKKSWSGVVIS